MTEDSLSEDQLSAVFTALGDRTRRDLVARLAVGDATVNELAARHPISLQAVSKHLKVLEEAGLVSKRREAQRRPVHLEAEVFSLMTAWIERYRRQAEERYQRLDAMLANLRSDGTHDDGTHDDGMHDDGMHDDADDSAGQQTPGYNAAHDTKASHNTRATHNPPPIRQGEAS